MTFIFFVVGDPQAAPVLVQNQLSTQPTDEEIQQLYRDTIRALQQQQRESDEFFVRNYNTYHLQPDFPLMVYPDDTVTHVDIESLSPPALEPNSPTFLSDFETPIRVEQRSPIIIDLTSEEQLSPGSSKEDPIILFDLDSPTVTPITKRRRIN